MNSTIIIETPVKICVFTLTFYSFSKSYQVNIFNYILLF